jgi:hypothetical protein
MTDDYTRGLDEIRTLRERLAHLEEVARASTTRPDGTPRAGTMLDAIGDHYAAAAAAGPVDPKTRDLRRRAFGFHPIAQMEADAATRAKNPDRWDAAQPPGMAGAGLSMYLDARDAFIKLGGTIPDPEKED